MYTQPFYFSSLPPSTLHNNLRRHPRVTPKRTVLVRRLSPPLSSSSPPQKTISLGIEPDGLQLPTTPLFLFIIISSFLVTPVITTSNVVLPSSALLNRRHLLQSDLPFSSNSFSSSLLSAQYDRNPAALPLVDDPSEPEEQTSSGASLCDAEGIMALGMESGEIADSALSASSAYEMLHVGPNNARLRTDNAGGAWCPQKQLDASNSGSEWIQVDLGASFVITGVATQGRYGKGMGQEFTEAYRLLYSRANAPDRWILWRSWDNVSNLEGNIDANTVEEHHLEMPIVGVRQIRLLPLSNYTRTVCLRFELYGCPYYGPISYSTSPAVTPNSSSTSVDSRLLDGSYDGALGKLVDGVKPLPGTSGVDRQPNKDSIWLAWPPASSSKGSASTSPISLVFEFDGVTNCSTVAINALNSFTSNVRVFSLATIAFSLDGRRWSETTLSFHYQADSVIQLPRDVLIHLQYRIGRFVRIELTTFSSDYWLHLSEVAFDCRPLNANLTSGQVEVLFSRLGSQNGFAADASSSGTRYSMVHQSDGKKKSDSLATLVPAPHGHGSVSSWNTHWKLSLIVICLCAFGLVIISFLASLALKKLQHRKSLLSPNLGNVFLTETSGDTDGRLSSSPEGATINLKTMPPDYGGGGGGSPLYCEPKEFTNASGGPLIDPEYAIPDVICAVGGNLSKTLHYGQLLQPNQNGSKPNAISCKTLQQVSGHHPSTVHRSSAFYASSDLVGLLGKQNIYGTRPVLPSSQQQILNVFDIGSHGLARTLNNNRQHRNNFYVNVNGTGNNTTLATPLRVYSEAEVGVLQSLGKCKFGDVLLCNVPPSSANSKIRRLAVVRTVNDLNLKSEFIASMSYARTRSLACDRFARLFGVIETPTYYASLTEAGDCDLHYYLRRKASSGDFISYETLLYIAGEIASAGAYLEAVSVSGAAAQQQQTHRDIAARNVIIYEASLSVKLTDVAAYVEQYSADYVDGLPLRWMPPAAVVGRRGTPLFTLPGDVYAFGVTLWEILTTAQCRPFAEYTDEQLVAAMYAYVEALEEEGSGNREDGDEGESPEAPRLPVPTHCTPEMADLIEECTAPEEHQRPTFKEIALFLQRKTMASKQHQTH